MRALGYLESSGTNSFVSRCVTGLGVCFVWQVSHVAENTSSTWDQRMGCRCCDCFRWHLQNAALCHLFSNGFIRRGVFNLIKNYLSSEGPNLRRTQSLVISTINRQGNIHNHLANFLKATKISGIAHIDALRIRRINKYSSMLAFFYSQFIEKFEQFESLGFL